MEPAAQEMSEMVIRRGRLDGFCPFCHFCPRGQRP